VKPFPALRILAPLSGLPHLALLLGDRFLNTPHERTRYMRKLRQAAKALYMLRNILLLRCSGVDMW
jgi:hypothetical protein